MKIINTRLKGVFIIEFPVFEDNRGAFKKVYHKDLFLSNYLDFDCRESFFSVSKKDVIRGMHFQLPPYQHKKLVYVAFGRIVDVVLDLRKGSPTEGKYEYFYLSDQKNYILYIPEGFAHGFGTLSDNTMVVYLTTREHAPEHDAGIRWDSFGCNWTSLGIRNPIISDRDASFPRLEEFAFPFVYGNDMEK